MPRYWGKTDKRTLTHTYLDTKELQECLTHPLFQHIFAKYLIHGLLLLSLLLHCKYLLNTLVISYFRTIQHCGLRYIAPDALKHNKQLKSLWVISCIYSFQQFLVRSEFELVCSRLSFFILVIYRSYHWVFFQDLTRKQAQNNLVGTYRRITYWSHVSTFKSCFWKFKKRATKHLFKNWKANFSESINFHTEEEKNFPT